MAKGRSGARRRIQAGALGVGACLVFLAPPTARANTGGEEPASQVAGPRPVIPSGPIRAEERDPARASRAAERTRLRTLQKSESDFFQALSAHQQGDLAAAETGYRAAIRGDADFVEARVNLARVLVEKGKLDAAHKQVARALSIQPEYPAAYAARALIALQRSDWIRARGDLERALALDPSLLEARVNLGALLLRQGELAQARAEFERAQETAANDPEVVFNRGLLEDLSGRPGDATYFYLQFLDLTPPRDPLREAVTARLRAFGSEHLATGSEHLAPLRGEGPVEVELDGSGERGRDGS